MDGITKPDAMFRQRLKAIALKLEAAAQLRAGIMDSPSKAEEIQKQVRQIILQAVADLREL